MNKLKNLLTKLRPILIVGAVIGLIIFFLIQELKPKEHFLTISATPPNASIFIDGVYSGVGSLQTQLIGKRYQILVSADGFEPQSLEVVLNKAVSLNINLEPLPDTQVLEEINNFEISRGMMTNQIDGIFVGVNRFDSLLYLYSADQTVAIHKNPVYDFDFEYPNIALIETRNQHDVVIINLETGLTSRHNLSEIEPVVDLAFVPGSDQLYLLAKLNVDDRTTTLYQSGSSLENPTEILTGKATNVDPINQTRVILFEGADAYDASLLKIVDVQSKTQMFDSVADSYLISPNNQFVLMKNSAGLKLYDTKSESLQNRAIELPSYLPFFLSNNQPAMLVNNFPGVEVVALNPTDLANSSTISLPDLAQSTIRWVVGAKENLLIVIDTDGKVWQLRLENN